MALKKVLVCEGKGNCVHVVIRDNMVRGIHVTKQSAIDDMELSKPEEYQRFMLMIDSGTAVLTDDDRVAVYEYTKPWISGQTLYLMDRKKYEEIINTEGTAREDAEVTGLMDVSYEDKNNISGSTSVADALGSMAFGSYSGTQNQKFDEAMNPPVDDISNERAFIAGIDATAIFCAPKGSDACLTATILNKECKYLPEASKDKLLFDTDKRFPTKYVPVVYQDDAGFVTLHKGDMCSAGYTCIPTENEQYFYRFFPLRSEGLDIYPDVLADVISSDQRLQTFVNMSGKVKIAVHGIKGLFADDESEEKKEAIKKIYGEYLVNTHFFRILHISWKTGLVTAITPDSKVVLLCAGIRKGKIEVFGLKSFIPIKKSIGLVVIGFDNIDHQRLVFQETENRAK